MTDTSTPTPAPASGRRRRRPALWWAASAATLIALVAAAFVVVPRLTGQGPKAQAADITNWEGGCHNDLTNGDTRRGAGGWWLNCDGMEAYAGKRTGGQSPEKQPDCILLKVQGLFISDADMEGVEAIRWDYLRGWNTQGGKDAVGPDGGSTLQSKQKAAGAIIGVKADGTIKFDHQYGSNVWRQVGTSVPCKGPNP